MNSFRPCIIFPVYNHQYAITGMLEFVGELGIPCFLINDGSNKECAHVLEELSQKYDWVTLLTHGVNLGKGAAVKTGLRESLKQGFSHALQIDADGQHCLSDIPVFLALAEKHPQSIITGKPEYDNSVPASRFYARYITHVWVWINTLSLDIKDSMCGFRVYPLLTTVDLITHEPVSERMAFDTDILVRSHWRGINILSLPTKVCYPEGGVSHFHTVKDNVLISRMHALLFFGMLLRLPEIFRRKFQR